MLTNDSLSSHARLSSVLYDSNTADLYGQPNPTANIRGADRRVRSQWLMRAQEAES